MGKNGMEGEENMEMCEACAQHYKDTPRGEEEIRSLVHRLNRIVGQVNGIKKMIEENRYCGEVLVQVSAVESAMRSFGYLVLEEHMNTCVSEKIRAGDENIIKETVELVKRLS